MHSNHNKLLACVVVLFVIFVTLLTSYVVHREEEYHIDLLQTRLQDYNQLVYSLHNNPSVHTGDEYSRTCDSASATSDHWISPRQEIRLTVTDLEGNVLYESTDSVTGQQHVNHLSRSEFQQALATGQGFAVMRKSETLGHDYFYSATRCGDCIVRSALPYDTHLKETISGDYGYLYAAILVTLVLVGLFYYMSRRMGKTELNNQELQTKLQLEKEYNQYKYELSHNIAHELKTPVASVLGYLETIIDSRAKGNITDEQMTHFLERSYSQTQRLNALVQDISTLNKITGSRTVEKEEVDLSALVGGIIDEVALKLELQEMTVVNDLPKNLKLWCNASMVYSIFRNLTDNAIAYAGKGTQIHIGFYQEPVYGRTSRETTYYFSFYDNGPGISEEHLSRIFERFYRVDKGRSRKLGGTGLGLAIVKNAVVMQGGSITAKNRPEGGLEFVFSLVG